MSERSASWRPGQTVCRCCLAEGCYKDISTEYFWMGKREVYADMLLDTFDVNISFSQAGGPGSSSRLICEPCISRLRDASEFKRQVLECEKAFVQQLEPGSSTIDVDDGAITLTGSEIKVEAIKLEKSLSDDEDFHDAPNFDDDDDDLDDQPLTTYASRVPKKESVDILELLDTEKTAEKRKMPVRSKATSAKKLKAAPKTVVAKAATSKTATKTGKVDTKKKEKVHANMDAALLNAVLILRYSTALPFKINRRKSIQCCYCARDFDTVYALRAHVNHEHCDVDLCKVIASNSGLLRVDVSELRCTLCVKAFDALTSLAIHLIDEHGFDINMQVHLGLLPMDLNRDDYACLVCGGKFVQIDTLYKHVGSHYAKHICDVCAAGFETFHGMNKHILRNHTSGKLCCALCKESFESLDELKRHTKSNTVCHRYRCKECNAGFLSWERRREHLVEAHNFTREEYPCPQCDLVFKNQKRYYRHFKKEHTDDHKCVYCRRGFSTKRDLEEHLPKHTGLKPHQCPKCGKTFTTGKGMRDHMEMHKVGKSRDVVDKHLCPVCDRVFVFSKKLLTHLKKVHSDVYEKMTVGAQ